ncbi:MAG: BtpA/SgcQ family protein [Lachnospiraceae bacterium]|nr:BtpA/SgcQ family protein [Lachnospiraceae bacterium]
MWTKEMFGTEKPIIALLHLDPLPGDPGFCGSLDTVIAHAASDLNALQDGGVDGVLIANEFSFPMSDVTRTETLMAMTCVIGAIRKDIRVPFGTNVVLNPAETIRMAAATGASFGRSAFSGAFTGTYGVHVADWGENVRLKYALGRPDLQLLCKVNPEGDVRLADMPIKAVIDGISLGGHVGAFCVSGPGAGQEASWDFLKQVCELAAPKHVPVFCNTGCRQDTIERILTIADGGCVGTAFKGADGRVDINKVKSFMEVVKKSRGDR